MRGGVSSFLPSSPVEVSADGRDGLRDFAGFAGMRLFVVRRTRAVGCWSGGNDGDGVV